MVKQEEMDEDKFRVAFESAMVAEEFLKDKSSKSSLSSSSLPPSSSAASSSTYVSSGVAASESDIKNTRSSQSSSRFSTSPQKSPSFFGRLTERFFKGSLASTTKDPMKSSPSYSKKSVHFEDELEVAEGQVNSYPLQPRAQSPSRGTNTFEEVVSENLLVSLQERYQHELLRWCTLYEGGGVRHRTGTKRRRVRGEKKG